MESQKELTPEQQRVVNREHEQWLALPITQGLIRWLEDSARLHPPHFSDRDSISVFQANAIGKAAYQQIASFMQLPPYPSVENAPTANVFDFNDDEE